MELIPVIGVAALLAGPLWAGAIYWKTHSENIRLLGANAHLCAELAQTRALAIKLAEFTVYQDEGIARSLDRLRDLQEEARKWLKHEVAD